MATTGSLLPSNARLPINAARDDVRGNPGEETSWLFWHESIIDVNVSPRLLGNRFLLE
ncbi:MAG: hypothetical protein AB8F65_08620 [Woeseiaceae bacterium]